MSIGPFSRRGRARGKKSLKACDHDTQPVATLRPFGVLEVARGEQEIQQLWLAFGHSRETSDFILDALELWWQERGPAYLGVRRLQIELDNGPQLNSSRTQFLARLQAFADQQGLEIELVYFPPYHSKYNPIEHCWGALEQHWNGALLTTIETALKWAATMTWKGLRPIVREVQGVYARGVRLTKAAFRSIAARLQRSATLPKWNLTIKPHPP